MQIFFPKIINLLRNFSRDSLYRIVHDFPSLELELDQAFTMLYAPLIFFYSFSLKIPRVYAFLLFLKFSFYF